MQKNYEKNDKLMISIFLFVAYVKENLCNLIYRQLLNAHHTKKTKGRILVCRRQTWMQEKEDTCHNEYDFFLLGPLCDTKE